MDFPPRIMNRAGDSADRLKMLEIASRPEVKREMLRLINEGKKPVTALSRALIAEIGDAARDHTLRQLAGEAVAHIVETEFGCVRVGGGRRIKGDPVFENGQPFRAPSPEAHSADPVPNAAQALSRSSGGSGGTDDLLPVLVAALSDASLGLLIRLAGAERARRAA